ncbi:MAG: 7TM diverse intracellular signaling domain-containing protein [Leptospiraceae bacterium]|nr:7TM diverse intracellular signaling domain-containing protein [Leptospiraceae bacterium]
MTIFILMILSFQLYAEEPTLIDPFQEYNSVNSSDKVNWYYTTEQIDPVQTSKELETGELDSKNWKKTIVPGNFFSQTNESTKISDVWFMFRFRLKEIPKFPHISLGLGTIDDREKTYLNGELIGETGIFNHEKPQGYDKIRIYAIDKSKLYVDKTNVILVRVQKFFPDYIGIEQDELAIGTESSVKGRILKTEYLKLGILGLYIATGGYFLFLFIRRRKEYENLYFGLFSILLIIYLVLRNQIKFDLGIDFWILKKIEYLLLPVLFPVFTHFIREFFKYKWNLLLKILDGISSSCFIVFLITNDINLMSIGFFYVVQSTWLLYSIWILYLLIKESLNKNLDAILILIGMCVINISITLDTLSNWYFIIFPRTFGYVFIIFVFNLATILANRFVRLNKEVEALNLSLEKKVLDRTESLNQTLQSVNELKVKQDGDYFLTSLLLNPLIQNKIQSDEFEVEFYISQKKKFEFKKKIHEIGGDICITDKIYLQGKSYLVFLNGDAMGKSIQGAGGALVLGVVFNAILNRSYFLNKKNISPELWLKNSFIELQSVFESFNCLMMVSIVLGLIQEDSYFLYYINGEHPSIALYRDGRASFMDYNYPLFKLGTPHNPKMPLVQTFRFEKDDALFIGSDGKDDLVLSQDETNREINMDENLFLRSLEKSKGNIEDLVRELEKIGEFSDDLSIMKIYLKNKTKTIPHVNREEIKQKVMNLFSQKKFKESILILSNYLALYPEEEEFLLFLSYAYKRSYEFKKSIDFGEKLLLRDPSNIKNLLNLTEVYISEGNLTRSIELLSVALQKEQTERQKVKLELLEKKLENKMNDSQLDNENE